MIAILEANRIIPFTRPHLGEAERAAVWHALERGYLEGNGPIGASCEKRLEEMLGVRRALLVTSGTAALEMAMLLLRLQPGDEVIMPSFAFVTAATAVTRMGARPIFAEIRENTYNLDAADVAQRITSRTRAIVCVHYAGQACDMDALQAFHFPVIEDAAQAIGAKLNGRHLGTIGALGCLSFHVTKNITCGEGGALLTNDAPIARRAEIIRSKGTNRAAFLRGEISRYTWVDEGSSYGLSDVLAAILSAQLHRLHAMQEQRSAIWRIYQEQLADLEQRGDVHLPVVDERADPNWHIYAFRVADEYRRGEILLRLKERGVMASSHFVPLHSSPYARQKWGYRAEDLPITERVAASLIRLPIYPDLSRADQAYIINAVHEALT